MLNSIFGILRKSFRGFHWVACPDCGEWRSKCICDVEEE
jgi:DTW domain-containing protein YfiP